MRNSDQEEYEKKQNVEDENPDFPWNNVVNYYRFERWSALLHVFSFATEITKKLDTET